MTLLSRNTRPRMGIIGFGAFGRLMAQHLAVHFDIIAYDPALNTPPKGAVAGDLARAAQAKIVVLAVPVSAMRETVQAVVPHLQKGALLLDVGSVKMQVAKVLRELVPPHVDVIATHPLFGPQSARGGLKGLKIALCPLHGARHVPVAAFLRRLGLRVIVTSPENHDRELAMVQGLTHLIAKVLGRRHINPASLVCLIFFVVRRNDAGNMNIFKALQRSHGVNQANPPDGIVASSQRHAALANSLLCAAGTIPLIFRDNFASDAGFMSLRPKPHGRVAPPHEHAQF